MENKKESPKFSIPVSRKRKLSSVKLKNVMACREKENIYPSFGEELETQIDTRLGGLCIGISRLRSRRRRAGNERDTGQVLMDLQMSKGGCSAGKPRPCSCYWVREGEPLLVQSQSSHSHWGSFTNSHCQPLTVYQDSEENPVSSLHQQNKILAVRAWECFFPVLFKMIVILVYLFF